MNGSPAADLVRGWVELYTRGLPAEVRAGRRDEVDDDLWCQHDEACAMGRSSRSLSGELFMRLLLGIPSDLSWRLAQRAGEGGAVVERSQSMSVRVFGALALIAGASWGLLVILAVSLGIDAWNGFFDVLLLVGAIGFTVAAIGLAWRFQDQIGPIGAVGALLVALGTLPSVQGAYGAILMFPIGSAALAWELGRAGILPRAILVGHLVGVALFMVMLIPSQIDYEAFGRNSLLIALAFPYMVSWVAIGASLLRGVPLAHEPAAGA